MWSYVHTTSASFKAVAGQEWPGDSDARVYDRADPMSGAMKKTITFVKGIPDAVEETFEFRSTEKVRIPVDNGQYQFLSATQAKDAYLMKASDSRNAFLAVLGGTGSNSTAIGKLPEDPQPVTGPQLFGAARAILDGIEDVKSVAHVNASGHGISDAANATVAEMLRSRSDASGVGLSASGVSSVGSTSGVLAAAAFTPRKGEERLAELGNLLGTPVAAAASTPMKGDHDGAAGALDAAAGGGSGAGGGGELPAGQSAEEDGRSDAAGEAPAVRLPGMDDLSTSLAALAGGVEVEEVGPALKKRRTKESVARDTIVNARQAFQAAKNNFAQMNSDKLIFDLTQDKNKPGFLVGRLRTAKSLASAVLGDSNLAGNLEEEVKEQTILSECVKTWKDIGIDELRPRVVDRFLSSLARIRTFENLLKCAPPTIMFKEQAWLLKRAIAENSTVEAVRDIFHLSTIRSKCPSMVLCSMQDMIDGHAILFAAAVEASLDRASGMGSIEQKGDQFEIFDVSLSPPGFFASDHLASMAVDLVQVAKASETAGFVEHHHHFTLRRSLKDSFDNVMMASADPVLKGFRENRQVGMKLVDRARVAVEALHTAKKADEVKTLVGQQLKRLEVLVSNVLPAVLPLPQSWKPRVLPALTDAERMVLAAEALTDAERTVLAAPVAEAAAGDAGGDPKPDDLERLVASLGGESVSSMQAESAIRMAALQCDDIMEKLEAMQQQVPPPPHVEELIMAFGGEVTKICKMVAHRANLFLDYLFARCTSMDRYFAEHAQKDVNEFTMLLESQWSVLVQPYAKYIKTLEAQTSRKSVLSLDSLYMWIEKHTNAWIVFIDFVQTLGGGQKSVIPLDADALQDQWADALMAIAQDPQARSALAKLCDAHKQVLTVPDSMACGQRQAYDKWVRTGITAFTKMLQHLAVHTTKAIVGGAVEDLKLSLVVIGVKELIVNLNMQPPVVDPSTLNFVQPEEQIKETLMIANAGDVSATRRIAMLVSTSAAKHLLTKTLSAMASSDGSVAGLMPAVRVGNAFMKEVLKLKDLDLEPEHEQEVTMMNDLLKQKLLWGWTRQFQQHLDKDITRLLPKDYCAIVSTQVTASINQVMFTRAKVLLVQSIDQTVEQHEFFKKMDLVQLGSSDEAFIMAWKRLEQNIIVCNQYALTWDCCDLILNKLPSSKFTEASKVGFIRECPSVVLCLCSFLFLYRERVPFVQVVYVYSFGSVQSLLWHMSCRCYIDWFVWSVVDCAPSL